MSPCFLKTVIDGISWQDNVTWKRISDCLRLLFLFLFSNLWVNFNVYESQGAARGQVCWWQELKRHPQRLFHHVLFAPSQTLHTLLPTSTPLWAVTHGGCWFCLVMPAQGVVMLLKSELECMRWLKWSNIIEVHSKKSQCFLFQTSKSTFHFSLV